RQERTRTSVGGPGERVWCREWRPVPARAPVVPAGRHESPAVVAARHFSSLRAFDELVECSARSIVLRDHAEDVLRHLVAIELSVRCHRCHDASRAVVADLSDPAGLNVLQLRALTRETLLSALDKISVVLRFHRGRTAFERGGNGLGYAHLDFGRKPDAGSLPLVSANLGDPYPALNIPARNRSRHRNIEGVPAMLVGEPIDSRFGGHPEGDASGPVL